MKKLLLFAPLLAWSGALAAQQTEAEADQCTEASRPVIGRVDIATVEQNASGAVLRVDIEAALPEGGGLTYDFRATDGAISDDGASANWSVAGAGPFNATVEVSAPGSACTAFAYLTYALDQQSQSNDEGGEGGGEAGGE